MTEKKNGVFELEKEEMASVSGGGLPYDPPKEVKKDPRLIEQPHCPGCGLVVESYSGQYKCTTSWCTYKGDIIELQDLIWK